MLGNAITRNTFGTSSADAVSKIPARTAYAIFTLGVISMNLQCANRLIGTGFSSHHFLGY